MNTLTVHDNETYWQRWRPTASQETLQQTARHETSSTDFATNTQLSTL